MKKKRGIKDFFKDIFRKKVKVIYYEPELTPDLIRRYLPDFIKKEIALQRARADKLEEENQKLKEKIAKLEKKIEEKELREAYEIERRIKLERKKRRKYLLFQGKVLPYIISIDGEFFRDSEGKEYKFWSGLCIMKTPYGAQVSLVLRDKEGNKALTPPVAWENFPYLFSKDFAMELLMGKITINMHSDGTFIFPWLEEIKVDQTKWLPEVKQSAVIDLTSVFRRAKDDPEMMKALLNLYQRWNDALQAKREAEEREKELLASKIESDLTSTTTMKVTEKVVPNLALLTQKLEDVVSKVAPLRIKEQEAFIRMGGAEAMAGSAWEVAENLITKIKQLAREMEVKERAKLLDEVRELLKEIGRVKGGKPETE